MRSRSLFRGKGGISEFASASLRNRIAPRNNNPLIAFVFAGTVNPLTGPEFYIAIFYPIPISLVTSQPTVAFNEERSQTGNHIFWSTLTKKLPLFGNSKNISIL
jgi:hypothetical protein